MTASSDFVFCSLCDWEHRPGPCLTPDHIDRAIAHCEALYEGTCDGGICAAHSWLDGYQDADGRAKVLVEAMEQIYRQVMSMHLSMEHLASEQKRLANEALEKYRSNP